MKTIPETFSGTAALGMSFPTERAAAVADLVEYATAGGLNSEDEAVRYLDEGKDVVLAEMARNGWVAHRLVVEDWDNVCAEAREALES